MAGRLVESAAAEQREKRSNNRRKLRRPVPAVRMRTIERLLVACKDATTLSIEVSGRFSRYEVLEAGIGSNRCENRAV